MIQEELSQVIIDAIEAGNRVWVYGNGGSYSTAAHFSEDLAGKNRSAGLLWPVYALGSQQLLFTANCNDNCFVCA